VADMRCSVQVARGAGVITYPRYLHHKDKTVGTCLACPLPDCVGTEHRECPIRKMRQVHKLISEWFTKEA
jgi:hypothetical protein